MKKTLLSLDPSVNSCGWATVAIDTEAGIEDWHWGEWKLSGKDYVSRVEDAWHSLVLEVIKEKELEIDGLVAEWPTYYHSDKGRYAAMNNYTINLAGVVMYIAGRLELSSENLWLYTAPQWKGSVPKRVTAKRFFASFGQSPYEAGSDAVDAVMMLLFHCKRNNLVGQIS